MREFRARKWCLCVPGCSGLILSIETDVQRGREARFAQNLRGRPSRKIFNKRTMSARSGSSTRLLFLRDVVSRGKFNISVQGITDSV